MKKKKGSEIIIECTPVNEVFGKVKVSTDTGTMLFTALYSTRMYKTQKAIVAMAKNVLSAMIESGKIPHESMLPG